MVWQRVLAVLIGLILGMTALPGAQAWPVRDLPSMTELRGDGGLLANPRHVAVDSKGRLYVVSHSSNSVSVFESGWSATSKPLKVLRGASTGLVRPVAVAFDADDMMYVVNSDSVTAYDANWASGSTSPTKTLRGGGTGLLNPTAIAFDSSGLMYITNSYASATGGGSVTAYVADWRTGNTPPIRQLTGLATGLLSPRSLAFDSEGRMIVINADSVSIFSASWISGNTPPMYAFPHHQLGLLSPRSVAVDDLGFVFTSSDGSPESARPSITVHAPIPAAFGIQVPGSGWSAAPVARITGESTRLARPWGLAVDGDGHPVVANDARNSIVRFGVQSQLVSISNPTPKTLPDRVVLADASASVSTVATSGLLATVSSTTPKVCTGTGKGATELRLLDVGTCTVEAMQDGNQMWLPAPRALMSFTVHPSPQEITVRPISDARIADRTRMMTASTTSGLPVIWRSASPTVCSATRAFGHRIVFRSSGMCQLTAEQPGNRLWAPAANVTVRFRITR